MTGRFDGSTTPPTLRLEGALGIECAAELQALLVEALAAGQGVEAELTGVSEIDLTGLQLLTAAERTAAGHGQVWVRRGALPESLRRVAEEAGWERIPFAGEAGTGRG